MSTANTLGSATATPATRTRYALIVANSTYNQTGLSQLHAPAQDAEQLAAVLRDPRIGGFDVRTILDGDSPEVMEAVEEFFDDRLSTDVLLLYFSCHGIKDENGDLYFASSSTKLRRLAGTAVPAHTVNQLMNRTRARQVVLLLDCCYSGAFGRNMTARAGGAIDMRGDFQGRGRAVITASSALEYAFEAGTLADGDTPSPSVFTHALVEGLSTGDADQNRDGLVSLVELYDYVFEHVRSRSPSQTPSWWASQLEGEFHVARNPAVRPATLPDEILELLQSRFVNVPVAGVHEVRELLAGEHRGMALAARLTLESLSLDDSNMVRAAAKAALADAGYEQPVDPVLPGPGRSEGQETQAKDPGPQAPESATPNRWARGVSAVSALALSIGLAVPTGNARFAELGPLAVLALVTSVVVALVLATVPTGHRSQRWSSGVLAGSGVVLLMMLTKLWFRHGGAVIGLAYWAIAIGAAAGILVACATRPLGKGSGQLSARRVALLAVGMAGMVINALAPRWVQDSEHLYLTVALGLCVVLLAGCSIGDLLRRSSHGERVGFDGGFLALLLINANLVFLDLDDSAAVAASTCVTTGVLLAQVAFDGVPRPLLLARVGALGGLITTVSAIQPYAHNSAIQAVHTVVAVAMALLALVSYYRSVTPRDEGSRGAGGAVAGGGGVEEEGLGGLGGAGGVA
ncbi:caspase family protein [Actinokineospora terrae]|uniref:Caspase domain-containing protein n=1 Tax=Actinokineospora terrae TaxID=155974 RepID=A0A1H9WBU8_9PSEU|nr:caspase family protein [Actinokineospora terrae]SES31380.1 Caspase domain-containing protein [Actinokineospora terrae]